eukprot:TRINITY_DN70972_c0_g1_i1.p1 TRINITY_DN70972_c0_g1~~TRINITY_DN70972_c0_g1_i1.p1  ORF type:complete len:177 (+),score=15.72 TRINITY_DN70972_c0_g1_i1:69-533(+)
MTSLTEWATPLLERFGVNATNIASVLTSLTHGSPGSSVPSKSLKDFGIEVFRNATDGVINTSGKLRSLTADDVRAFSHNISSQITTAVYTERNLQLYVVAALALTFIVVLFLCMYRPVVPMSISDNTNDAALDKGQNQHKKEKTSTLRRRHQGQ